MTNICSGKTHEVMFCFQKGWINFCLKFLMHPSKKIAAQTIWLVGNVAGDSAQLRDYLLEQNILEQIYKLAEKINEQFMIKNLAWTFGNLVRGKPIIKNKFRV